jgi:hypothetical protein
MWDFVMTKGSHMRQLQAPQKIRIITPLAYYCCITCIRRRKAEIATEEELHA